MTVQQAGKDSGVPNTSRVGRKSLINITPTDRVFLVGASGCGKTTLLTKTLLPRFAHVPVILDPKGQFPVTKNMPRTDRFRRGQAQVITLSRRQSSPDAWDDIIGSVVDDRRHTLVVDDLYGISGGNINPRPNLLWAITGGRSLGVPVWLAVQRPSRLPVSILSESEHYFVFMLRDLRDRKTIAGNTSPDVANWMPKLGFHDWVYYHGLPPYQTVVYRA